MTEIIKSELELKAEETRIDANIADAKKLFSHYGKDRLMVRNLLIYLYNHYQSDMWGYTRVDPHDFAAYYQLKNTSIRKPHKNPYQKIKLGAEEFLERKKNGEEVYNTVFENALYQLAFNPADITYWAKDDLGTMIQFNTAFQFIEGVRIERLKGPGKAKKYYSVRLPLKVRENLNGYFFSIYTPDYVAISNSSSLTSLYLYLVKLRNTLNAKELPHERIGTPYLSKLLSACEINCSDPKNYKYLIEREFKLINDRCKKMSVTLEWDGPKKMEPILIFDFSQINEESVKEKIGRFRNLLMEELLETYIQLGKEKSKFGPWLKDARLDHGIKRDIFVKVNNICYGAGHAIDKYDEKVTNWLSTGKVSSPTLKKNYK